MKTQKNIWNKEYRLSKNKWKKETKSLPKLIKGKTVLEVGVGNGKTLISILSQKPKKVYAIDYSSEAIFQCKQKPDFSEVDFKEMDIKKLDFDDGYFDVIVCNYVLNNLLSSERKKAAQEICRVLKKKSILLIEDFSINDFRQKLGKLYKEKNTIIKKNGIICHFFTKEEVLALFNELKNTDIKTNERITIKFKDMKRKTISASFTKNN